MNKLHEALAVAGALVLAHLLLCAYLLIAKRADSRKRGLVLVLGNCLLLLVFYIPARLAPREYIALFGLGFIVGFAALLQYAKRMAKRDDELACQNHSQSESN